MDEKLKKDILHEQMKLLEAAKQVLEESSSRVRILFQQNKQELSIGERESCEALTARFSRLCDFLFQRVFRTIDAIELQEEGTALDRLNRMEKRGIISSATLWKTLRDLRNDISHEYLIEKSDRVLRDALHFSSELILTVKNVSDYAAKMGYQ